MKIGRLNKRVTIQNATAEQDETGFAVNTYATAATVWASIEPLSEHELYQAQQAQSEATIRVGLRHTTHVTSESRLIYGSRTLEVVETINPAEKNERLILLCKEVT